MSASFPIWFRADAKKVHDYNLNTNAGGGFIKVCTKQVHVYGKSITLKSFI